jgi:hypothetical protein
VDLVFPIYNKEGKLHRLRVQKRKRGLRAQKRKRVKREYSTRSLLGKKS